MYQEHFDLRELPFELTPDPKYLLLTPRHREALGNLEYGLFATKSLTLLIGEAGTGKSTLLQAALASERCRSVRCVYVKNPALTRDEFISLIASRFDLGADAAASKGVMIERLELVLRERRARGEITALIVDEAQRLSTDLLEELRLLGNIETPRQKLLPLVLAGQPELAVRLEAPELRQLKQRVALRCELAPFELLETATYMGHRIRLAGGSPSRLFTREAVRLIHAHSNGIPRTINVICDNALVSAMALNRPTVDQALVVEVCRDFALQHSEAPARSAAAPEAQATIQAPESGPEPVPAADDHVAAGLSRPARFLKFGSGLR